jgi:tetratricopeptide (TPR) repeat protein
VAWGLNNLGNCLRSLGRKDEALRRLDAALEMYQRIYHGDHPHVAAVLNNLAGCLRAAGRTDEALPKYEAALAMRRRILPSGHIDIHASEIGQGRTLTAMQRFAESERLLTGAYSALADHPKARGTLKKQALEALVELYEAWARSDPDKGHDTRAAEWRDKINAASVSDS